MSTKVNMDIFRCDTCGRLFVSRMAADMCCKQYCCDTCGIETPKYVLRCDKCHKKIMFEKATKIKADEYEAQYPSNPLANGEFFFDDWDELVDKCAMLESPVPEYVNGTFRVYGRIDPDRILTQIEEELDCEDVTFDQEAYEEFREFAEQWNKSHEIYCYHYDKDTIVFVPDEVRSAIDESL